MAGEEEAAAAPPAAESDAAAPASTTTEAAEGASGGAGAAEGGAGGSGGGTGTNLNNTGLDEDLATEDDGYKVSFLSDAAQPCLVWSSCLLPPRRQGRSTARGC